MPPLRKLRVGALEELAKQLRFAPAETLRRQLERAEQLSREIDPAVNYPEDWVVFRVTGYRPQIEAPAIVVGEALIGDMSALVERLSAAAKIGEKELEQGKFLAAAEVQARWGVSRKTLERYRLRGLVARRVVAERGVSRLAFLRESVERFEVKWKERVDGARGFSRIEKEVEARMARRGAAYQRLGCSLNQAAVRIAKRYGRAQETVRQVLRRSVVEFDGAGPPTAWERRLIERAWWWGVEPGKIARRLERPSASVQRVIVDVRAERLKALKLPEEGDMRAGQVEKALASPECTRGLGAGGEMDVLEFVRAARETPAPEATAEKLRVVGYHGLLARAAGGIAKLKTHGNSATLVDRIETDLRWAARIKVELVRSTLAVIVRTLESSIGRPLEEVRAAELIELLRECLEAAAGVVDGFHAGKGGRLAAPVGLAATRIVARSGFRADLDRGKERARSRLGPGVRVEDWTRRVAAWQSNNGNLWLELHASVRAGMGVLTERARRLLEMRYGWGGPARTVVESAKEIGLPVVRAAAMERRAIGRAGKAGSL